jgi:hypothetical protein
VRYILFKDCNRFFSWAVWALSAEEVNRKPEANNHVVAATELNTD